jgi:hypothetical protein
MPHGQVSGKFHRSFAARGRLGQRRRRRGAGVHQPLDGRPEVIGGEVGIPLDHPQRAPAAKGLERARIYAAHREPAGPSVAQPVPRHAVEPGRL